MTSTIEPYGLLSGRNWGMATIRDRLGHITSTQRLGSIQILISDNLRPVCWPWLKRSWVPTDDEPKRGVDQQPGVQIEHNGMVRRFYPAVGWVIRNVRRRSAMELSTPGIDLGKTVFHLVGMNQRGEVVLRKRFTRTQLLHFTANLKVELIGMEACGGSHFLGRALREQGHEVRLIPAQYVKPHVKTNKNDYIDAEGIAEAVGRPRMRFVPVKSDDQLDLQSLHRVRERWVMRRTAVVNQIRGLLLERGITLPKGRRYVDAALPGILAEPAPKLSGAVLVFLTELKLELAQLAEKIDRAYKSMEKIAQENEACQRLVSMPGVGPVISTAIIATIGNGAAFRRGRDFAAWLGVFPKEHSTGGKQTLWKIPQRGNQF